MTTGIRKFTDDFRQLVESRPEKTALIIERDLNPIVISYERLGHLTDQCLGLFGKLNLTPGDTLFSLMPNAAETLVLFLATMKGGYGFAPLPCTSTRSEIERWIQLIDPKICFTTHLISDDAQNLMNEKGLTAKYVQTDASFSWLPSDSRDSDCGDAPRVYITTSGTSGTPKAIVLDGNRLWSSGCAFMDFHNLLSTPIRMWNYLPMSYLGGLFNMGLIPLSAGGSIVIGEPFSGKTFLGFWQYVERFEIDTLWFVPTIVRGLLKLSMRAKPEELKAWGEKIRVAFLGTAPIDLETKTRFEETFGIGLLENFALSETTFFTSETPENKKDRVGWSVGEVLPYTEVKLIPISDEDQPSSEICIKSPYMFLGYLEDEGQIEPPGNVDGYFPTGDLGHLNDKNMLVIDGRKKDIIKAGGYFVSLREVELLAEAHAAVQEAAAVKIPHEFYGESYILFIIAKDELGESCQSEIAQFIHQNIDQYKWPEKIEIKQEFPRTASGKIKKHLLSQSTDAAEG
jgi:acyl-CoA synthetase (AMP-forming)/AMP-acid ligase II